MSSQAKVRGKNVEALMGCIIKGSSTLPPKIELMINGRNMDGDEIRETLTDMLEPFELADQARGRWQTAINARDATIPAVKKLLFGLVAALTLFYDGDAEALGHFGISPPAPQRTLTSEEKAARARKSRATRDMRGTKGKRQKAAIKAIGDFSLPAPAAPAKAPAKAPANGVNVIAPTAANPVAPAVSGTATPTNGVTRS